MTSSDIIDTGFSIQLKQTGKIIQKQLTILHSNDLHSYLDPFLHIQ